MSENTLPPRVSRWTQKLLDLSLRNRLLNVRDSKCVLPLYRDTINETTIKVVEN